MKVKQLTLISGDLPEVMAKIPDPPAKLHLASDNWADLLARPCISIVGSRKVSAYGRAVTTMLAGQLARAGVVVVSGLALGVDALAHRAALEAGGLTIAVLPGSLDAIYPASHRQLADDIVGQGGALITEYASGSPLYPVNFIARNRLVSGLSRAVLITEAAEKSGTLHTARFALEQGRDVLAVPGNITSPLSAGTNNLIKAGAAPITSAQDVFDYLGISAPAAKPVPKGSNPSEQVLIDLIARGVSEGSVLLEESRLDITAFNRSLTMLEITGKVRSLGGNQWSLQ